MTMRLAVVCVTLIAAAPCARADSFMISAQVDPQVESTIHALFRTSSPLDHLGILESNYGGNPAFFDRHLEADPGNDLRVLDAAISHAAPFTRAGGLRARKLLGPLIDRATDAELKVVVAVVLAQSEAATGGRASWTQDTADKRQVAALLADACAVHVAKPIPRLGEVIGSFLAYAASYRGYAGLLDSLASCGKVRAPEQSTEGIVVHERWRDGSPRLELEWHGGKRNGRSRRYFADGTIERESTYADNREEGLERQYYPTGRRRSEVTYVHGFPDGPAVYYHPNGKKSSEGRYHQSRQIGVWRTWDRAGALVDETDHGNASP